MICGVYIYIYIYILDQSEPNLSKSGG